MKTKIFLGLLMLLLAVGVVSASNLHIGDIVNPSNVIFDWRNDQNVTYDENGMILSNTNVVWSNSEAVFTNTPDAYITGTNLDLDTINFSLSVWVKVRNNATFPDSFAYIVDDRDANDDGFRILYANNTKTLYVSIDETDCIQTSTNIDDGLYHHIFVVANRSENLTTYIDGVEVCSVSIVGNDMSTTTNFRIGSGTFQSNLAWEGIIDEITIWNNLYTDTAYVYNNNLKPNEDQSITADTTLCPGTYYLNDSNANGAIIIGASNVVLDCNGAIFIGNASTNSYAVYGSSKNNVTIKNCDVRQGYSSTMRLSGNDNTFTQNKFYTQELYILDTSRTNISNNSFLNSTLYPYRNSYDCYVGNNTFDGGATILNLQLNDRGWIIENNLFINLLGTNNRAIATTHAGNNTIVRNNVFNYMDKSFDLYNTSNFTIYNNTFINITQYSDAYNIPIKVLLSSNVNISNNTVNDIMTRGIYVRYSRDVIIQGNDFLAVPLLIRNSYNGHDYGDVPCAISISHMYKGIEGAATPSTVYLNDNITILNNNFDENVQCLLENKGGYNVTNDLTDYWYWAFQSPTIQAIDEFYLSNNFDTITNNYNGQDYTWTFNGWGSLVKNISFSLHKTYLSFNTTQTQQVNLYNLSTPYNDVYNATSGTVIAQDKTEYNVTLSPGDEIIVGDYLLDGCVVPVEDLNITSDTTFCLGTYYLNDTNFNGSIKIGTNNVILDCNNAILIGNNTVNNTRGVLVTANNVTIKNCDISGYRIVLYLNGGSNRNLTGNWLHNGVWLVYASSESNSSYYNNIFTNGTTYAIQLQKSSASGDYYFINNIVNGSNAPSQFQYANSLTAYGNNFSGVVGSSYTLRAEKSNAANIYNNIFDSCNKSLYIFNVTNSNITNNVFTNQVYSKTTSQISTYMYSGTINISDNVFTNVVRAIDSRGLGSHYIQNNYINGADIGIFLTNVSYSLINGNNLTNITKNNDGYNLGVYIYRSNYVNLLNNNITYGHVGVWAQRASDINISGIYCNQYSLEDISSGLISNINNGWYQFYEPSACILLGEQYEGWLGDSSESMSDIITKFRIYNVTNASISGITADANVQTYLHTVGVFGATNYNLPTYWYNKIWMSTNMTDYDEFYNNPLWDSLQVVPKNTSNISTTLWKSRAGMGTASYTEINYSISKTNTQIISANSRTNDIQLFNLTLPFNDIYNSTSGQILATNRSEYNVTLSPGDVIYVADYTGALNFTVTTPTQSATYTSGTQSISFSAVSNNGVSITNYSFSDGTTLFQYPTTSSYTTSGESSVTLTLYATDSIGSTSSSTVSYSIQQSSGGGSSGGGSTTDTVKYSITPDVFDFSITKGDTVTKSFTIQTLEASSPLTVTLVSNLSIVGNKVFSLQPGTIQHISFNVVSNELGLHNEKIIVNVQKTSTLQATSEINVAFDVKDVTIIDDEPPSKVGNFINNLFDNIKLMFSKDSIPGQTEQTPDYILIFVTAIVAGLGLYGLYYWLID